MNQKLEMLYEGKAKQIYATENPEEIIVYFKDDATAFNAQKKGQVKLKGEINNAITTLIFEYYLALRNQITVDQHIHRCTGLGIQFNHRTRCQLKHIVDGRAGASDLHRQLDRNVQNALDVGTALGTLAQSCHHARQGPRDGRIDSRGRRGAGRLHDLSAFRAHGILLSW